MSDFSQLLTDTAEESLMLLHGDVAGLSYTPPGGATATYTAELGPEEAQQSVDDPGVIVTYRRIVSVRAADLAAPSIEGVATVGGVAYAITAIERSSGGRWQLTLHRTAAAEISRQHYRRTR